MLRCVVVLTDYDVSKERTVMQSYEPRYTAEVRNMDAQEWVCVRIEKRWNCLDLRKGNNLVRGGNYVSTTCIRALCPTIVWVFVTMDGLLETVSHLALSIAYCRVYDSYAGRFGPVTLLRNSVGRVCRRKTASVRVWVRTDFMLCIKTAKRAAC
jgi:hypothetical protein